jgi:hypothetical protein
MSTILEFLISSLGKLCKLSSSRSRRSFIHDHISGTAFMEDHAQDMLYIASSTAVVAKQSIAIYQSIVAAFFKIAYLKHN